MHYCDKQSSEAFISSLGNLEEILGLGDFMHVLILRFNEAISEAVSFSSPVFKWYYDLHPVAVHLSPNITKNHTRKHIAPIDKYPLHFLFFGLDNEHSKWREIFYGKSHDFYFQCLIMVFFQIPTG